MILCYGAVKLIIMFTFQTASQFPKRDNHSADHVWFFCVLFPIFRYHNESPTHFDSIIENALPWVIGHMGHGSSIQWVTWVMGHSKWPIAYPGTEEELPRMQAYWWIAAEQCDSITLQQAINLLICSNIKNIMFHRNKNIKYKTKKLYAYLCDLLSTFTLRSYFFHWLLCIGLQRFSIMTGSTTKSHYNKIPHVTRTVVRFVRTALILRSDLVPCMLRRCPLRLLFVCCSKISRSFTLFSHHFYEKSI